MRALLPAIDKEKSFTLILTMIESTDGNMGSEKHPSWDRCYFDELSEAERGVFNKSTEWVDHHLNLIRGVGFEKPIGELPIMTIVAYCGSSVPDEIRFATQSGLHYTLIEVLDDEPGSGVLRVFHKSALRSLLHQHAQTLIEHDWPTDPKEFMKRVREESVLPETSPVCAIVDQAFGNNS